MIRKPLDLPPAVARAFVEDMRAYFTEENPIKRDGIAVRQLRALREHRDVEHVFKTGRRIGRSECSRAIDKPFILFQCR